jgi:hypothetical protein
MEATGVAGVVPAENTGALLRRWLGADAARGTPLALSDVLWYLGAISGVAAAIAILDGIPESHRDLWEFLASLGFLAAFAIAAWPLTRRAGRLPGGLALGMAAAMVPAVGYGFTQLVDAYPGQPDLNPFATFSGAFFAIALATAAAAVVAYLLTSVASNLALAVVTFLLASQFLASSWQPSLTGRATTALLTGSFLVAIALLLDAAGRRSAAFWPYAGGLTAVTVAFVLYAYPTRHLGVWIAMLALGTVLVLLFPIVRRRTWAVFGAANLAGAVAVAQVASDGRGGRAIAVGAVITGTALLLDRAERRREAFWLYVGGLSALAEGLVYLAVTSPQYEPWIPMLAVGTALLAMFIEAGRKTWLVFGALGVAGAYATAYVVSGDGRAVRALIVAVMVVSIGLAADVRGQRLLAFWLQAGGLLGIAAALTYLAVRSPEYEPWIPMLAVGAALLVMFIEAGRKTWAVFGALGVVGAYATAYVVSGDGRAGRALVVAVVVVAVGLAADARAQSLTGFWAQVGGFLGITAALIYLAVRSPAAEGRAWVPMLVVGAILLLGASLLQRRTWVVFGAAGVAAAFGHYLDTQSSWFRYVLLVVALAAFAAGLLANRARSTGTG